MAHFPMLEDDVAARVTVPFSTLTSEKLRGVLEEWGFAVVAEVLPAPDCTRLEAAWGDDLRSILSPKGAGSIVLSDPVRRWPLAKAPLSKMRSFASDYGIPQGRLAWGVRLHPNVQNVYGAIYGQSERLCVGLDLVFFSNAAPHNRADRPEDTVWPHCDQSAAVEESGMWEMYQSVVYVWPADESTSATVVWPKSHREEYDKLSSARRSPSHFCRCNAQQTADFVQYARRVAVPAGGMLVWNSRLIHQGWSFGPRLAVPVCFEPMKRRTEEALGRKHTLVKTGGGSTHWASLGLPHNCSHATETAIDGFGTVTKSAHLWIEGDSERQNAIQRLI